jgi:tripartite-type tricarboxylate transporter receptor subunit TctC
MVLKRLLFAALAAFCAGALAQPWPSKPIHIVAPYAAGGAMDLVSRALAAVMTDSLKAQVVVENRTGGQGMIGAR